jgi:integrase/recombinase XerD
LDYNPDVSVFKKYQHELAQSDRDQKTIARYSQIINSFEKWLGDRQPDVPSAKEYIAYLRDKGYQAKSLLLYYHAIRLFFEFLGQPLKLKLRKPDKLPPYHDRGDIEALIIQAEKGLRGQGQDVTKRKRNRNLILVFAYTGMRKSELLNLRVNDIDFNRRTLTVKQGKGQRDRVIPMAARIVTPLRDQCSGKSGHDRVFDNLNARSVYRIVSNLARSCGLEAFHPHSLRHYFGTQLVERGANLRDIQELMGHQSLETTAVYIDVCPIRLAGSIALLDQEPDLSPQKQLMDFSHIS